MIESRTATSRNSSRLRYGLAIAVDGVALAALAWFLIRDARSGPTEAEVAAILQAQLGGDTTIVTTNRNSFGLPAANLTNPERRIFEVGDSFFTQNWVTAPASTEARDGLGPILTLNRALHAIRWMDARSRRPIPKIRNVVCCSGSAYRVWTRTPALPWVIRCTAGNCRTGPY